MYKKVQRLEKSGTSTAPLNLPLSPPISGWETVSETNVTQISQKMPCITNGLVYTYLAQQTCNNNGESTFRSLTRGYTHWKSGCIHTILVNVRHPNHCHVQSVMKPGSYQVWIMLQRDDLGYATVLRATCQCAAGYALYFHINTILLLSFRNSASCTHVSALLHALASMTSPQFALQPSEPCPLSDDDETPVTSLPCQWKAPKLRKERTLQMSGTTFEKHM